VRGCVIAWLWFALIDLISMFLHLCVVALDVAPASPFIASKGRARVTFVVKR
jgi:hypothetical protein